MIIQKSEIYTKIKCGNCGDTAWRMASDALVCLKCYYNPNCPRWMKKDSINTSGV